MNSRISAQLAFQSSPNSFRSFLSITLRQTTERAFCHVRQSLDYIFVNLYLATVKKESLAATRRRIMIVFFMYDHYVFRSSILMIILKFLFRVKCSTSLNCSKVTTCVCYFVQCVGLLVCFVFVLATLLIRVFILSSIKSHALFVAYTGWAKK